MREIIYKGTTRPAMKWGVPLVALIGIMAGIVASVWLAVLISIWIVPVVAVGLVAAYGWMRWVTYRDDQRLLQMVLHMKLAMSNPNRKLWKARSYTPHTMRKPSHVHS
jgi:type IV secretion system protein VirB3